MMRKIQEYNKFLHTKEYKNIDDWKIDKDLKSRLKQKILKYFENIFSGEKYKIIISEPYINRIKIEITKETLIIKSHRDITEYSYNEKKILKDKLDFVNKIHKILEEKKDSIRMSDYDTDNKYRYLVSFILYNPIKTSDYIKKLNQ